MAHVDEHARQTTFGRRFFRSVAAVVALGTAGVLPSAAAARLPSAASHHVTCSLKPGRTVAANPRARVYLAYSHASGPNYYGCVTGSGTFRLVGSASHDPKAGPIRSVQLAGPFATSDYIQCDATTCIGGVSVIDLRTGKTNSMDMPQDAPNGIFRVTSLLVTASGTAVWIRPRQPLPGPEIYDVFEMPFGSPPVRLDSSPAIAPTTLAVSAKTVFWINAAQPHVATIP